MKLKNSIVAFVKTFAWAALVFALVLLPPSASHASSNMHDIQYVASENSDHSSMDHTAASAALTQAECGSLAVPDSKDHASGKCCSGICSSVDIDENSTVFVGQTTSDRYVPLNPHANSVEQSGFLRPPQFLI
jgi:hypothetical protein